MERRLFLQRVATLPLVAPLVPALLKVQNLDALPDVVPEQAVASPAFDALVHDLWPLEGFPIECWLELAIQDRGIHVLPGDAVVVDSPYMRVCGRCMAMDYDMGAGNANWLHLKCAVPSNGFVSRPGEGQYAEAIAGRRQLATFNETRVWTAHGEVYARDITVRQEMQYDQVYHDPLHGNGGFMSGAMRAPWGPPVAPRMIPSAHSNGLAADVKLDGLGDVDPDDLHDFMAANFPPTALEHVDGKRDNSRLLRGRKFQK